MRDYIIITDVASDLPKNLAEKYEIEVIGMNLMLDKKEYYHTINYDNLSNEEFYTKVSEGAKASTSQISPGEYVEFFSKFLAKKYNILYICLSSGLSATYQSANIAKSILMEKYKKAEIMIVDSLQASIGEGYLAILASINKMRNLSLLENVAFLDKIKYNIRSLFTVDDLMYLSRGGRLSKSAALVGSAIKIKPLLKIDHTGKLVSFAKIRTRKKAISKLIALVENNLGKFNTQFIYIIQSRCDQEAMLLKEELVKKFNYITITVCELGPVVGTHTGPGLLGVVFLGKNNSDTL